MGADGLGEGVTEFVDAVGMDEVGTFEAGATIVEIEDGPFGGDDEAGFGCFAQSKGMGLRRCRRDSRDAVLCCVDL